MGRMKKKGTSGAAVNYITRNKAIKKLQISLAQFRRLCIWKGIFPRQPRNRKKAFKSSTPSTTFYYRKDIQYLLHEPLIQKFRDQRVLENKIAKALGRGDYSDAKRLEANAARPEVTGKPRYTLNHIIRERYPTFIDALRDLDDCLSMLFLFANLRATSSVPSKMVAKCERLCLEFQHYLIVSHSLRKSFLSIKGIYYQANIQGEDILWLVPYKFTQQVIGDIDFRVMGTFVEFYMTLLGFVNFRLYTTAGLKYPPKFDQAKDSEAAELAAFTIQRAGDENAIEAPEALQEKQPNPEVQRKVNELLKNINSEDETQKGPEPEEGVEEGTNENLDKFEPVVPGGDILPQPSYSTTEPGKLFANFTFYLSRETPRAPLEFILRAFGCKRIGWDTILGEGGFTNNESDPRITHQVVDRPVVRAAVNSEEADGEENKTSQKFGPNKRIPGRIYIQPQWVWDSINDEEAKDIHNYVPGAQLPPHLSPFVERSPGQYDPTVPLEKQELQGEGLESDIDSDEEEDEDPNVDDEMAVKSPIRLDDNGMTIDGDEDEDKEGGEEESQGKDDGSSFAGFSEGEKEEAEASEGEDYEEMTTRQLELDAELKGNTLQAKQDERAKLKAEQKKRLAAKAKEEADELERRKGMMTKKKRRLYDMMERSKSKKSAEDEKLMKKRRKIERSLVRGKA